MSSKINKIAFIACAFVLPYTYYFMLRPKLLEFENKLDSKITSIKPKDLDTMKQKMEDMKGKKE